LGTSRLGVICFIFCGIVCMSASRSAFSFQPKASHKDEQQRGKIQHSNTRLRLHIIHYTVFSTYSPIPFMSHPHRLPTCPSPKHFSLSSSSLLSPCNPSPNSPPYTRHRLRRPFILPRTLLLHTLYHNLVFKLPRSLQMHFGCRPQFRILSSGAAILGFVCLPHLQS
jgi:hypothetical protein